MSDLDVAIDHAFGMTHTAHTHVGHVFRMLDNVGQRVPGLKVLSAVAVVACLWRRTIRPLFLAAFAMLAVNAMVGTLKVLLGRGAPLHDQPRFFTGGDMFPSGHAANVVSIYGLCAYLVLMFGVDRPWLRKLLGGVVVGLVALQFCTSIGLQWHWFSDLVAGVLIGAIAVLLTVAVDRVLPHWIRRSRPVGGGSDPAHRR